MLFRFLQNYSWESLHEQAEIRQIVNLVIMPRKGLRFSDITKSFRTCGILNIFYRLIWAENYLPPRSQMIVIVFRHLFQVSILILGCTQGP